MAATSEEVIKSTTPARFFSPSGGASLLSHRGTSSASSSTSQSIQELYIYGVVGSILRLSAETPREVLGLCTGSITTCFAVILVGKHDRVSLLHMTQSIHLPSIMQEQEWTEELERIYIAYNPSHPTSMSLEQCCRDLEEGLGKKPECIKTLDEKTGGTVVYRRKDKTCFTAEFAMIERQNQVPKPALNNSVFYLNQYFTGHNASFLHYDSQDWQKELELKPKPLAIYHEALRKGIINDDTDKNRAELRNFLVRKIILEEPGYFFDMIREKMKDGSADATLDRAVNELFIYAKEAKPRAQERLQDPRSSLIAHIEELSAKRGWGWAPGR